MSWTYRAGSFLSIGEKRNKNDDVKIFGGRAGRLTDNKNIEILKVAKSFEKSSFSSEKLLFAGSRRRIRTLTNRVRVTRICKLRCVSVCFLVMLIPDEKEL